jgi:hypothetical protein
MPAAEAYDRGRGPEFLLTRCSALDGGDELALSPLERLQAAIGADLARLLVNALAGARPRRGRFDAGCY